MPSYTHISPTGTKSLIDLALLWNTEHLQHCTTIPPLSTSDHLGISLVLTWKARAANPCKSRKVWLYKEGNYTRASQLIAQSDWNTGCDIDKAVEQWSTKFLAIMDECIPSRYLRPKQNLPWITTNIVQHIRKCNMLLQRAKRSNKEQHWSQYKKLCNEVVHLLCKGKQLYFSNLMCTNKKNFWKSVKLLTKNRDSLPTLKLDDCSAVNDEDKANRLNTVFAKFWNTAEPPLTETAYLGNYSDSPCDEFTVTNEEVLHLISGLDIRKANGPYGISAYMPKATTESIASPLAKLFSLSLSTGKFPTLWKSASIVPIPKSTNKLITGSSLVYQL